MFSELSLSMRLAFAASILAIIALTYGLWHHSIYKSGEDACQARYTAAAVARATTAQKEISTIGDEYAKINQNLQKDGGFSHPVSPVIADVLNRLPNPTSRAK